MNQRSHLPAGGRVRRAGRVIWAIILLLALIGQPGQRASAESATVGAPGPRLALAQGQKLQVGVSDGEIAWGDYNNDGSLDLLATGMTVSGAGKTSLFVNNGGSLSESSNSMAQVQSSSVDWGDYDNDGYLDVLLTGQISLSGGNVVGYAAVYHNSPSGAGRTFTRALVLPNIYEGDGVWGDYNNDGRLDFILTGNTDNSARFTKIYKNNGGGSFGDSGIVLTPLGNSSAAWGDFDRDGYVDLAISGLDSSNTPTTLVYRNNYGYGFNSPVSLAGVWNGTANWLDLNNNGYLDLLLTGNSGTAQSPGIEPVTKLYRFKNLTRPYFEDISAVSGLPSIWNSAVTVGDFNNDGYTDVALNGRTKTALITQIYSNDQDSTFTQTAPFDLPIGADMTMAWGDYDGDGTLDLVISGIPDPVQKDLYDTYLYHNDAGGNSAPSAPNQQAACWDGSSLLTFYWDKASDTPTPVDGLSYNLRVGTTVSGVNIVSPEADLSSGRRRLPEMGNFYNRNSATLIGLPNGAYYWSVQAVDTSYVGGPFANNPGAVARPGTSLTNNDAFAMFDNEQNVPLDVLSNDTNHGLGMTIYRYSNPSHGTLTLNATHTAFTYTPEQPYGGTLTFSYYARDDTSLYCTRATVTLNITQYNDKPTDITLSNTQIVDGALPNTPVGTFSTVDPDSDQTFTYSLVTSGHPDSSSFTLAGNRLLTTGSIDISKKTRYSIRVRSTDSGAGNLWVEKDFTITVIQNHTPTEIKIDKNTIQENLPINTLVGNLSTTDPDTPYGDAFTYALVSYQGNNYDNASFNIDGNMLRSSKVFDYSQKKSYQIRIRSTDLRKHTVDQLFTITITPAPVRVKVFWKDSSGTGQVGPAKVTMSEDQTSSKHEPDPFALTLIATDVDTSETLTWSIHTQAAHGEATVSETTASGQELTTVQYKPAADWNSGPDLVTLDTFVVRASDTQNGYADITIHVTVLPVNDEPKFTPVPDQTYVTDSGPHTITISGISAGPADESTQKVALTPYIVSGKDTAILSVKIGAVQNGKATLTVTVGGPPGTYTIKVVANDGQSFNQTSASNFNVTLLQGIKLYLPEVMRSR